MFTLCTREDTHLHHRPTLALILLVLSSLVQWGSCKDEKICAETSGDKSLLLCFKDTMDEQGGVALSSWNVSGDPSSWRGIVWNNQSDHVLQLNLSRASLSGKLWPVWCRLPLLRLVDFSNNNLTGHLGFHGCHHNASHIQVLILSNNSMSGNIPESISTMGALKYLDLESNKLTGSIPQGLRNLIRLKELSLAGNSLNGSLPPELGYLTNLQYLSLAANQLSGSIPPEISHCTRLHRLVLFENLLSGEIPSSIGRLSNLIILGLVQNNFTDAVKHMASLKYLSLSTNQMGGPIPSWLGNLKNLRHLILYRNNFTGSIPPQLGSLKYLKFPTRPEFDPDLSGIQVSSNLSPSGGDAQKLLVYSYEFLPTALDLCENKLSGTIPAELGQLQNLQHLWLCDNLLSGPIPSSLANATHLILLQLYDNQLTGQIPPELTSLTSLSYFNVSNNNLSGSIPASGQFSTFNDASAFSGNPGLCGRPLNKSCTSDAEPPPRPSPSEEDENGVFGTPFGVGAAVGLSAGFWAVFFLVPESFVIRLTRRARCFLPLCLGSHHEENQINSMPTADFTGDILGTACNRALSSST